MFSSGWELHVEAAAAAAGGGRLCDTCFRDLAFRAILRLRHGLHIDLGVGGVRGRDAPPWGAVRGLVHGLGLFDLRIPFGRINSRHRRHRRHRHPVLRGSMWRTVLCTACDRSGGRHAGSRTRRCIGSGRTSLTRTEGTPCAVAPACACGFARPPFRVRVTAPGVPRQEEQAGSVREKGLRASRPRQVVAASRSGTGDKMGVDSGDFGERRKG